MPYTKPATARNAVTNVKNKLERIKTDITKNVSQMDLENASIQEEIEEIVNDMYRKIDEIKNQISVYYFE